MFSKCYDGSSHRGAHSDPTSQPFARREKRWLPSTAAVVATTSERRQSLTHGSLQESSRFQSGIGARVQPLDRLTISNLVHGYVRRNHRRGDGNTQEPLRHDLVLACSANSGPAGRASTGEMGDLTFFLL